jgi:hypothetical protein
MTSLRKITLKIAVCFLNISKADDTEYRDSVYGGNNAPALQYCTPFMTVTLVLRS